MTETQGINEKDNINQNKEQTQSTELVSPKAGTATSSPTLTTASQSINIVKVMFSMKKNAYEETHNKKRVPRI